MTFTLRPADPADLDALLAIAAACPEAPQWPRSAYAPYLTPDLTNPALLRIALVAGCPTSPQLGTWDPPRSKEKIQERIPEAKAFAAATLLLDGTQNLASSTPSPSIPPSAATASPPPSSANSSPGLPKMEPATSPSKSAPPTPPPSPSTSAWASNRKAAARATTLILKKMRFFWAHTLLPVPPDPTLAPFSTMKTIAGQAATVLAWYVSLS